MHRKIAREKCGGKNGGSGKQSLSLFSLFLPNFLPTKQQMMINEHLEKRRGPKEFDMRTHIIEGERERERDVYI